MNRTKTTRTRPHRLAAIAIVAFVLAGCGKEAQPPAQRPAPQVSVMTVAPKAIPYVATFVAQTESSQQVNVVARVSGFLDRIAYQEGELVKRGQLMFELDRKPFEAQLNAAKGELQAQQARFETARATYARVKPLAEQDALPLADLDRAKGELDASSAAVFAANAKVEQAELNLGYATITSPVTGLAGRALQRQGAFVNAMSDSAYLTYVAAVNPIWVNFSISQNQLAWWREQLKTGRVVAPANGGDYKVEIIMPDGTPYAHVGKINFADPSFNADTGSFLVRASLPNPKAELRPGMFVTANVKGATRPGAIVIPQLAVQQGSNGHLVYVINDKDVAEVRPVIVGEYEGDKDILIVEGLHAGDRVVVDGVLKVVPGMPVSVVPAGAPAAAPAGAGGAPKK